MNRPAQLLLLASLVPNLLAAEKPNIILVLVDDMGVGDMGLYQKKNKIDAPRLNTPNLDKMASRGVQLTRHYSAAPVSAPARASLFTGIHQGQALVVRNNNFDAPVEDAPTIATVLRSAGYKTALIGKWGIGGGRENGGTPDSCSAWPTKRGFDYFYGYGNHLTAHRHYPVEEPSADPENKCNAVWDNDKIVTKDLAGCYSTDLFTARAKQWIIDEVTQSQGKQPFFVALCLPAPHARLSIPAMEYPKGGGLKGGLQWLGTPDKMINTASPDTWDSYIYPEYEKQKWPLAAQRHATMMTRIDEAMGDLVHLLRDLKIDKNTYIIFTSDNGAHNEAGGVPRISEEHPCPAQNPHFFRSYGLHDGIKRDLWDGGLRVPCIVYAPSQVESGLVNSHPTQFHDWLSTCADIAGIASPARSTGVSLLPLLQGEKKSLDDNIVYSEYAYPGNFPNHANFAKNKRNMPRGEQQALYFRDKKGSMLKAIRTNVKAGGLDDNFQIYDTLRDPQEVKNLASKSPAQLQAELRSLYLRNRHSYHYKHDPAEGQRSACTGKRPYDNLLIPALQIKTASLQPSLSQRQIALPQTLPYVPSFDSMPEASEQAAKPAKLSALALPAQTLTELQGYIEIPADAYYKLTASAGAEGAKTFIKIHGINASEALPLHLEKGLHPVRITLMTSEAASPAAVLKLRQMDAPQSAGKDIPLPIFYSHK